MDNGDKITTENKNTDREDSPEPVYTLCLSCSDLYGVVMYIFIFYHDRPTPVSSCMHQPDCVCVCVIEDQNLAGWLLIICQLWPPKVGQSALGPAGGRSDASGADRGHISGLVIRQRQSLSQSVVILVVLTGGSRRSSLIHARRHIQQLRARPS